MKKLVTGAFALLAAGMTYAQSNSSNLTQSSNYNAANLTQSGLSMSSNITQKNTGLAAATGLADGNKATVNQHGASSSLNLT